MNKPKWTLLALAALASAGTASAQQTPPNPTPPSTMDHQQMMRGDGMMPMMSMMREMSAMMENCNKMMQQSMMDRQRPGVPAQPQPAPQGNRG